MPTKYALVIMLSVVTVADAKEVWLSWPAELLRPQAQMNIVEVELNIACGEIRAVRRIPPDWSVRVTRPISAQSRFSAEAGHGASSIPNLTQFERVIGISVEDERCFAVSGRVVEHSNERALSRGQFKWSDL